MQREKEKGRDRMRKGEQRKEEDKISVLGLALRGFRVEGLGPAAKYKGYLLSSRALNQKR